MTFTNLKGIDYNAAEVLLISDNNCFLNKNADVEMISNYPLSMQRNLNVDDFIHSRKKPLYYKYDYIIIVSNYFDFVFPKIKYYFADTNFRLDLIVDKHYKLEANEEVMALLADDNYKVTFNDNQDYTVINLRR